MGWGGGTWMLPAQWVQAVKERETKVGGARFSVTLNLRSGAWCNVRGEVVVVVVDAPSPVGVDSAGAGDAGRLRLLHSADGVDQGT